jgi:hypothetical protein
LSMARTWRAGSSVGRLGTRSGEAMGSMLAGLVGSIKYFVS